MKLTFTLPAARSFTSFVNSALPRSMTVPIASEPPSVSVVCAAAGTASAATAAATMNRFMVFPPWWLVLAAGRTARDGDPLRRRLRLVVDLEVAMRERFLREIQRGRVRRLGQRHAHRHRDHARLDRRLAAQQARVELVEVDVGGGAAGERPRVARGRLVQQEVPRASRGVERGAVDRARV